MKLSMYVLCCLCFMFRDSQVFSLKIVTVVFTFVADGDLCDQILLLEVMAIGGDHFVVCSSCSQVYVLASV